MPYRYEIDRDRGLILAVFTGPLGCADLESLGAELKADPGYAPELGLLVDLLGADMSEIDAGQLRERARRPPVQGPMVIVVGSGAAFGLARMYELAGESTRRAPLAICHERSAAVEWLLAQAANAARGEGRPSEAAARGWSEGGLAQPRLRRVSAAPRAARPERPGGQPAA